MLVGDELLRIGEVDAVVAGVSMRGATDAEVNLLGSSLTEIYHAGLSRSATDDRIIDDDDTFSLHRIADEVEFHANVEIPDELVWLDEGAADVVIADEGRVVGNSELLGETERRINSRIWYRNDDIGLDGVEARQLPPHVHTGLAHSHSAQAAVRAGEVDVLEDAEGFPGRNEGKLRAQTLIIDHHNLSRFEIADECGADQVEGTGLGGEHPRITELSERKGAKTIGIADSNNLVLPHDDNGKGPFETTQ